jgi:hypothetical protein
MTAVDGGGEMSGSGRKLNYSGNKILILEMSLKDKGLTFHQN